MKKQILIAVAVVAMASFTACGKRDIMLPDAVLINKANNYYAKGRYTQATENYRKSVEENPDSPYRKMAVLGLADSLYKDKSYFEAVLYYERFIELYPLDTHTPRAQFYLGMCYYYDSHSSDRDQASTKKAFDAFSKFIKKYPDHELIPFAKTYREEMSATMADALLSVANFYYRLNQDQAAISRYVEYIAKYPESDAVAQVMYRMAECLNRQQSYKKAAQILADIIERFPNDPWAAKAATLAEKLKIKK